MLFYKNFAWIYKKRCIFYFYAYLLGQILLARVYLYLDLIVASGMETLWFVACWYLQTKCNRLIRWVWNSELSVLWLFTQEILFRLKTVSFILTLNSMSIH
jgi:hypothetical protein